MAVTSAIVLFAVVWFMVMFVVLPFHSRSQEDDGDVVPGTHPGAPVNFRVRRTMLITTMIAIVVWAILVAIIVSGVFDVRKLGWV